MISNSYLFVSLPEGKVLKVRDNNILLLIRGHKTCTSHKFYQIVGNSLKLLKASTYNEAKALLDNSAELPPKPKTGSLPSFYQAVCDFQAYLENQDLGKATLKKWNLLRAKYLDKIQLPISRCTSSAIYDLVLKSLVETKKFSTVDYLITRIKQIINLAKIKYPKVPVPDISAIKLLFKPVSSTKNRPSMGAEYIPEILNKVVCSEPTKILLLLSMHLLLRPNEMVHIKLNDIQGDVLIVPKTKTMRNFRVPITPQAKALIQQAISLKKDTNNPYLFEGRLANTCINPSTINVLLKRAGFKGLQTAHGFRAMGRTWLEAKGVKYEVAEMCLSHVVGSRTCRAYIRTDYFEERVGAMNSWSEYVQHMVEGK